MVDRKKTGNLYNVASNHPDGHRLRPRQPPHPMSTMGQSAAGRKGAAFPHLRLMA